MFDDLIGPYAYGGPILTGELKVKPEDFIVIEKLGYQPSGDGEHVYCYVHKTGMDTQRVADCLASFAKVTRQSVHYAGLKDKQAQTEQWFSVHLPGKNTPDFTSIKNEKFKVLEQKRHLKKIKRGVLIGNNFNIRIRDIKGSLEQIDQKIKLLKQGVPNYFGLQRFGINGQNLLKAEDLLFNNKKIKNKQLKGLLYSSVRSWLFNMQLAKRVKEQTWNNLINGDLVNLTGTNSFFVCQEVDDELKLRLKEQDIMPAGLLWGSYEQTKFEDVYQSIRHKLNDYKKWLDELENRGLVMMTRSLVCLTTDLIYKIEEQDLILSFSLPKGSYATMFIRELVHTDIPHKHKS